MGVPRRGWTAGLRAWPLLVAALAAPVGAQAAPSRVLVLPLQSRGVSPAVAQQATDLLTQALVLREEYAVLTLADIEKMASVEQTRTLLGCGSEQCLADLSRGLAAELVVSGSLGTVGTQLSVNLLLVDPKAGKSRNAVSGQVKDTAALPAELPRLLAQLMGWAHAEVQRFRLGSGGRTSVAVLDLTAQGLKESVAANLTQVLSAELKRVDGVSVISREDIQAILQVQETQVKFGCDDMACLAEIGGALGVDRIVTGSVGRVADRFLVSLRLISARHSRVENLVTETFAGGEEQLLRAVRQAGRLLLGVEAVTPGALAVTASESGAAVHVNDISKGTLPLPPIQGLPPGAHRVRVERAGYRDWSSDVYVDPGETTVIWAELQARPRAWYQQWWVWTIMGSATAAGGALLILATGLAATAGLAFTYFYVLNTTRASVHVDKN